MIELVIRMEQWASRETSWAEYAKDETARRVAEAKAEAYRECAELVRMGERGLAAAS